uniref:arylamine N-acetyltransferase family protein n=1 Tax=Phascolarctobacterium faecium TaxID=33025 RepID=UPI0040281BAD
MKKQTALMNHWQLCQYLRKLHLPQVVPPPDLATLKLLQDAHLKYVPYENLDILSGRLTSLEHDDMFAKIIMKNRGGICFELNGLYNWLLESLGYKVTSYAARFIDRLEEYQIRRHRVMCIELDDKRYLTDVGVNSASPRG